MEKQFQDMKISSGIGIGGGGGREGLFLIL